MATRFWVGGTGNWDAATTTHWSATTGGAGGASVPTTSDDVTFDGASGGGTVTVTATANMASFTGGAFTGTLNTNGFALNCNNIFNFSGSATRTLTLGSSTLTTGGWDITTTTGLTASMASSTIIQSSNNGFNGGGLTYGTFTYNNASSITINGANTFSTFNRNGAASQGNILSLGANQTVTGTATLHGSAANLRLFVVSTVFGTARTITAATVALTNVDFQDITGAGAATWSGTSVGNALGNTGITFTTAVNRFWVATSGGNWSATSSWSATSGGASGASIPLPQDSVFINANSITAGASTITADVSRLGKDIDFTGVLNTPAFSYTASANISPQTSVMGNLTFVSGMTITSSTNKLTLGARSAATFDTGGITFDMPIEVAAQSGTYTLSNNLTLGTTRTLTITAGTLDASTSNFIISTGLLSVGASGTLTLRGAVHLITGTGTTAVSITNGATINAGTSTIKFTDTSNSAVGYFAGGTFTFNNFWFSRGASTGDNRVIGNVTFNDLKDDGTIAHNLLFNPGSTIHVTTWSVTGHSGQLITINTTTTATHNLVKDGGGTISTDFLNIQHSVATPGSTWYAGTNSVNNQGVATTGSGWIFTAPPVGHPGFFF